MTKFFFLSFILFLTLLFSLGMFIFPIHSFAASPEFIPSHDRTDDNPSTSLGAGRMPIRRVMVNWGDDSSITNKDQMGYYPNHKPFCEGEDSASPPTVKRCVGTQMTCVSDEDCKGISSTTKCELPLQRSFGDSSRACKSQYFEFSHHYTCSQNDAKTDVSALTPTEQAAVKSLNPVAAKVCTFVPKVQVLDNWGWCNGDCQGAGKGCWNDDEYTLCDSNNAKAWTSYKGNIIVVPSG